MEPVTKIEQARQKGVARSNSLSTPIPSRKRRKQCRRTHRRGYETPKHIKETHPIPLMPEEPYPARDLPLRSEPVPAHKAAAVGLYPSVLPGFPGQ